MGKADHLPGRDGDESHLASAGRIVPGVELLIVDRDGRPRAGRPGRRDLDAVARDLPRLPARPGQDRRGILRRLLEVGRLRPHRRQRLSSTCSTASRTRSAATTATSTRRSSKRRSSAHPGVMMSAVVGIADPDCGEYVHAEVVLRPGESVEVEELSAFLAARLSDRRHAPHDRHRVRACRSRRSARCCAARSATRAARRAGRN